MNRDDAEEFQRFMADALAFYKQSASEFAMSVWWQACQNFSLEQVRKALTAHAMDPDRGRFPPMPSDIVRHLQGTHTDRSLLAWGVVLEAISSVGAYSSVDFGDPATHQAITDIGGWQTLCSSSTDELPFLQKRFCEAHRVYSQRGAPANAVTHLAGAHEIANRGAGKPVAEPVRISGRALERISQ